MYENLEAKNLVAYAQSVYDNPQCMTREEFAEDYKRFKYVKRLCRRYLLTKDIDDFGGERLMLNHLVLLANVFGVEPTRRILFTKCDEKLYRVLKPFLHHLKYLSELIMGVNGKNIYTDRIPMDEKLLRRIREL